MFGPYRRGMSIHTAAAGLFTGAGIAAPGPGALVELAAAGAVALVAVDAVLNRADPDTPAREAIGTAVRAVGPHDTPAATLLATVLDLVERRLDARRAWRLACRAIGRHALGWLPIVGVGARVAAAPGAIEAAMRYVKAMEAVAAVADVVPDRVAMAA